MPFQNSIVGGAGALVRALIKSPNFVTGVSGWIIRRDGSAEFSNATIRGILIDSDQFVYNGIPAFGNPPIASICKPGTTVDTFGNPVVPDAITTYNAFGAAINCLSMANSAFFQYQDTASAVQGSLILSIASTAGNDPVNASAYPAGMFGVDPAFADSILTVGANINLQQLAYTQQAKVAAQTGAGANNPFVYLSAPEQGQSGHLAMVMQGTSPDGTQPSQLIVSIQPTGTSLPAPITQALFELKGQMASDSIYFRVPATVGAARPAGTEFSHLFSTLGYANGWLDGGRVPGKYRFIVAPPNSVEIFGSLKVPAGFAAGQVVVTLPAAYQPNNPQSIPWRNTTAGNLTGWLSYDAAGVLKFQGPPASVVANDVLDFHGLISLDG
jgi:hypothetical protein